MVIFLTGFMASGKTVVGRRLAEAMNCAFADTDQMVERRAGKTIAELFASEGEEEFRRLEGEAVRGASGLGDAVVALGGGAVVREENWTALGGEGVVVVCLSVTPDAVMARVEGAQDRPLLAGLDASDRLAKVRRLLAERAPYYARAAIRIQTDSMTVEQVVAEILDQLRKQGARGATGRSVDSWPGKQDGEG